MQNHPSPTPARRHISHGSSGQTPLTGGASSGSPSPIRRAPPSYESIRQSPEKSGKVQVNGHSILALLFCSNNRRKL